VRRWSGLVDDGRLLAGVRVLDLAKLIPGAATAGMLVALGADVVRVEPPGGTYLRRVPPLVHGTSVLSTMLDAGKRSVTLAVGAPGSRPALHRLAAWADVVVESSRPGVVERWGLDPPALAARGKVVVHLSAYGRDGPLASLPGHGLNLDGVAGLAFSSADGAVAPGWMPVSVLAGPAFAAQAACAALVRVAREGRGAELDVSCSEAGLVWQTFLGAPGWNPDATGDGELHGPPRAKYSVYATADGRRVIFCAIEPRFFEAFCREAGRDDLARREAEHAGDEFDFATHDTGLRRELEALFSTRPLEEWIGVSIAADVAVGPAYEPADLPEVPQHLARRALRRVAVPGGETVVPAWPVRTAGQPPPRCDRLPEVGADTEAVLREVGLSSSEVARLREEGLS
jgi:alpha-methylacyl-CoA racemase